MTKNIEALQDKNTALQAEIQLQMLILRNLQTQYEKKETPWLTLQEAEEAYLEEEVNSPSVDVSFDISQFLNL